MIFHEVYRNYGFSSKAVSADRQDRVVILQMEEKPAQFRGYRMDTLLTRPATRSLWAYFTELSKIPRGSKGEAVAVEWVAEQGRILGCHVEQDAIGNVLIRKVATQKRGNSPGVALQAHVDMVCEKNSDSPHDFLKDPLALVHEGDLVRATGTTLGADNGIGVCAALALLANKSLEHGPLEVLITVGEEIGSVGANSIAPGWLKAKYLLNLDGDTEGCLIIGSAGGVENIATRKLFYEEPLEGNRGYCLQISGLKGGHSGTEIHRGRGNAIRLLAQILRSLMSNIGIELATIKGGNKYNAIPRQAEAIFCMDPEFEGALRREVSHQESRCKSVFGSIEPGLSITISPSNVNQVLCAEDAELIIGLLLSLPHGVEAMSPEMPGFPQTSCNLGVVKTNDKVAEVVLLIRSSIDASAFELVDRISAICTLAGFGSEQTGFFHGWKPDPESSLVKQIQKVHCELFGKPMEISSVHAGLECGLIGGKHPGLEMVSLGPNIWDEHTPDERVSVASVENLWKLLVGIVEAV